jgi:hypothetical protein
MNLYLGAIKLLLDNPNKIEWDYLSMNPNLFLKNTEFCDEVFKILIS